MKATKFEYQHQTLFHLLLVGLSLLSYLRDPVDIVWALVRNHSHSASWERLVFGFGVVMLLGSAVLETWANARVEASVGHSGYSEHQKLLARILLVLAVGLLLPRPGAAICSRVRRSLLCASSFAVMTALPIFHLLRAASVFPGDQASGWQRRNGDSRRA
jgi:hypothetical protein